MYPKHFTENVFINVGRCTICSNGNGEAQIVPLVIDCRQGEASIGRHLDHNEGIAPGLLARIMIIMMNR